MDRVDTGLLLNPTNIKLQRKYFKEMTKLKGLQVIYRAPRENKHYNGYGELDSFYYEPIVVGCIYDEHPNQKTTRKLGWAVELDEGTSIIHVPYDLPGIQNGALFIVPSGLDKAEGRLFRVIDMSNVSMYPASIACRIEPVYENTFEQSQFDHSDNNFNLLADDEDDSNEED